MIPLRINRHLNSFLQCLCSPVISGWGATQRGLITLSPHQNIRGGNFLADQTASTAARSLWKEEPRIMWQWRYAKPSASRKNKNVSTRIKQNILEERETLSHTTLEAFAFLVFSSPSPGVGGGSLGAKTQHAEFLKETSSRGVSHFTHQFLLCAWTSKWALSVIL